MNPKKWLLIILGLTIAITAAGLAFFSYNNTITDNNEASAITTFEQCAAAGYPIMESYPEQCQTPDGRMFVRTITPAKEVPQAPCYIMGCSSHICSDRNDFTTTCEYLPEYGCYGTATCERQQNGQCGWTETVELTSCLMGK